MHVCVMMVEVVGALWLKRNSKSLNRRRIKVKTWG